MIRTCLTVVLALVLTGCLSTTPVQTAGCRLLSVDPAESVFSPPAAGTDSGSWLFDARLSSGRVTEDASGCLIEGVAPSRRVAETQVSWLQARLRAVCVGDVAIRVTRPVAVGETRYGFAVSVSRGATDPACSAGVPTDVAIGSSVKPSSRSMNPPRYPHSALKQELEGQVLLVVHVEADGSVGALRVERSSGHAVLDDAAQDAAAGWQFSPGRTHDGEPVAGLVTIPVDFFLD